MVSDVLNSLDLNPVLATLGTDLVGIVNSTVGALDGSGFNTRSINLADNILYSINDYSGNTHTNRILAQNGSIVDQFLDNDGNIHREQVVGYYARDMTFNGYNETVTRGGEAERQLEYVYTPYTGLSVVSAIFTNAAGKVVATQVFSEAAGGGTSSVVGEL